MREHRLRSVAKVASWRIIGTLDTVVISFLLTGSVSVSLGIGGIEVFTKIVLYYFHERAWNLASWGKTT